MQINYECSSVVLSLGSYPLMPPADRKVRGEYGMKEATHGLAHLDLQDQELKDMEVARKLQEEEIKVS